jgi:hypothetical protein
MEIDGDATRARVIAEMDRLVGESKAGDLAIIAYSGHGMRVRGYKRRDAVNGAAYHAQIALSNVEANAARHFLRRRHRGVDGAGIEWHRPQRPYGRARCLELFHGPGLGGALL